MSEKDSVRGLVGEIEVPCQPDRPYRHLQAAVRGKTLAIMGDPSQLRPLPEEEEETYGHNCDAMGCGTHHVLFRLDLRTFLAEAREEGFQAGRRSMASRIKARARSLGGDRY